MTWACVAPGRRRPRVTSSIGGSPGGRGTRLAGWLTGLAAGLVEQPRQGLRGGGALAARRIARGGPVR